MYLSPALLSPFAQSRCSFLLRRNAIDGAGNITPPPTGACSGNSNSGGGGGGGEKGSLKERMVRARGQLDDLVEQTAEQFRKMTVSASVFLCLLVCRSVFICFFVCVVSLSE